MARVDNWKRLGGVHRISTDCRCNNGRFFGILQPWMVLCSVENWGEEVLTPDGRPDGDTPTYHMDECTPYRDYIDEEEAIACDIYGNPLRDGEGLQAACDYDRDPFILEDDFLFDGDHDDYDDPYDPSFEDDLDAGGEHDRRGHLYDDPLEDGEEFFDEDEHENIVRVHDSFFSVHVNLTLVKDLVSHLHDETCHSSSSAEKMSSSIASGNNKSRKEIREMAAAKRKLNSGNGKYSTKPYLSQRRLASRHKNELRNNGAGADE